MLRSFARPHARGPLVFFVILIATANSLLSVRNKSMTYDEDKHLGYGLKILSGDSTRFNDTEMPVSALNALPRAIAKHLPPGPVRTFLRRLVVARSLTIGAWISLAVLVFAWAQELHGFRAGLLSLLLFVLDPNLLAHGQLVTTDLYATLAATLSIYCIWRYHRRRTLSMALIVGLVLGLAQLTKYTSASLYPLLVGLLVAGSIPRLLTSIRRHDARWLPQHLRRVVVLGIIVLGFGVLIVNAGFLFEGSLTRLRDYEFSSSSYKGLQRNLSALSGLPVPLPVPYLQGLDMVAERETTGGGYGRVYLLGRLAEEGEGVPGYFAVAFLFKEPIATQVLVGFALVLYVRERRRFSFLEDEVYLVAPAVFYFLFFNFFVDRQIGVRLLLVAFPFMIVFAGSLVARQYESSTRRTAAVMAMVAYLAASSFSYFPHYLAYFNELIPDRRYAYKVLADSNLDWGQSQYYLKEYLAANPSVEVDPDFPKAGTFLVTANELVGVIDEDPGHFRWLRECFEPVDTVAYSYLVFEVTPDDLVACEQASTTHPHSNP